MNRLFVSGFLLFLLLCLPAQPLLAADLTLPNGGMVSIELISSDAAFRNTLSVVSPAIAAAITGCQLEPADGLMGVRILSEKTSQRGCRVTLDADPATPGTQGFVPGTVLNFGMCAQTDADPACEFVWSSNAASNPDGFDHLTTTQLFSADYPAGIFRLSWEDQPSGGDNDFNDLIVVVRVSVDSDGDGLWDDWERFGIDTNSDGTIDLDLPALGANAQHKDIFLEIDWMDCAVAGGDCPAGNTHSHQPNPAAITAVVNAFANANVTNPDGINGINLHIDVSNSFAHQNFLVIPNACFTAAAGTGFDAVKANAANFGPQNPRRFAYHYALFTHQQTITDGGSSGCAELPGNDMQVSLGAWSGQVGTTMDQAGTLLHELGHNLNLGHGGGDGVNYKPNYLSVMSYRYQVSGIPPTDPDGTGPLTARMDYSRQVLPNFDQANLNEPAGVGDGTDTVFYFCPNRTTNNSPGNLAIDWNCNGVTTDTSVANDINGDSICVGSGPNGAINSVPGSDDYIAGNVIWNGPNLTCDTTRGGDDVQAMPVSSIEPNPLTGYWDWDNIRYDFQSVAAFDDGLHFPLSEVELDRPTFMQHVAADLVLEKATSPALVLSGANVVYTLTIKNKKPGIAHDVVVSDTLPPETGFVSCAATGGGICGGSGNNRTVTFSNFPGGATAVVTLVANVRCDIVNGATLANTATVGFSVPDPDPDPSDNSATIVTVVSNPAPVISTLVPDHKVLWPPNHKMVGVNISYTVQDNCGVPVCTLSVASNEPVNGHGDGNTAPDWQVLNAHRVLLRAERSGSGSGRVYTTTVQCMDSGGGSSSKNTAVHVRRREFRKNIFGDDQHHEKQGEQRGGE